MCILSICGTWFKKSVQLHRWKTDSSLNGIRLRPFNENDLKTWIYAYIYAFIYIKLLIINVVFTKFGVFNIFQTLK